MHAIVLVARNANARSIDFGKTVDVEDLDAQLGFNTMAHLFAPTLGTYNALLQSKLVADAALGNCLGKEQSIGGSGAQNSRLQVFHHAQLLFGVAWTQRNRHSAQLFSTKLEADASRPQAIARRNVNAVFVGDTHRFVAARKHRGPVINILLGIGNHHRNTRGARRRMDANDLFLGHGGQTQRIGLTQVSLFGERQLLKIFPGLNVRKIDALEFLRIEGRTLLQRLELLLDEGELLVGQFHGSAFLCSRLPCYAENKPQIGSTPCGF